VADLKSIPLEMVEKVEIHKGGASAEFGPGALGGVINIITQKNKLTKDAYVEGERAWGKWKTELYRLTLSDIITLKKYTGKLSYSLRQSVGDFDYVYESWPNPVQYKGKRINNAEDADNYFISGLYQFNSRMKLAYSAQYYCAENGLPDRATRQNAFAHARDRRSLLNAHLENETSPDHEYAWDIGFSRFEQRYQDLESKVTYDSKYTNDIITVRHSQSHRFLPGSQLCFGADFRRDILHHEDYRRPLYSMGKPVRDNIGSFLSMEHKFALSGLMVADAIAIDAALRFDWSQTIKDSTSYQDTVKSNRVDQWSPEIGFALTKGERYSYVLRANYGKSFCLPSINSLFWQNDALSEGNPGLRPERAEHSEVGMELKAAIGPVDITGGSTYFHSFIRDQITWDYSGSAWRPRNISGARITGHEDVFRMGFFAQVFSVGYQNTVTDAINKASESPSYNKRLILYPRCVSLITARLHLRPVHISYSIRKVDISYSLRANTKYYHGYQVSDLAAGLRFRPAANWHLTFDYRLNNITDESYVMLTLYPMPGREWNFGVKLTYGVPDLD
jgi:outer membrane cobalamin receptor